LEELVKKWAERSFSKTEKAVLRAKEKNGNKEIKEVEKSGEILRNIEKD